MDTRPSRPTGGGPDDLIALLDQVGPDRFGRRLRDVRTAAGLTQAELAGEAFSGTYVSRIEDGSRTATWRFVEWAAAALDRTPEALITGLDAAERDRLMSELDRGEFLLSERDSSPAGPIAEAVIAALVPVDDPRLTRRALRLRAGVREAAGELRAASVDLELVVADPFQHEDWVRDLISLNRCYREGGQLDRAIAMDERFGPDIARLGLEPTTAGIQFTVSVAAAHLMRGDLGRAMRLCKRSIARAEEHGLDIARGSALWNQSIVVQLHGDPAYALDLAREALDLYESSDDTPNVGKLRNHVADLKLMVDPPDPEGALALLDQVTIENDWSTAGTVARSRQLLSVARALRLLGNSDGAARALDESVACAPSDVPGLLAAQSALRGRLSMDAGDVDSAGEHYRRSIALLSSFGADVDAADLWFQLALELEAVGETAQAIDAYRRAGVVRGMRPTYTDPQG